MNKKILLIDDDAIVLTVGKLTLSNLGYDVVTARGGRQGLKMLEKYSFDLILLDLVMPDIDGISFLRTIKMNEKFRKIPVILQTGESNQEIIDKALELGVNNIITKPYDKQTLKDALTIKT